MGARRISSALRRIIETKREYANAACPAGIRLLMPSFSYSTFHSYRHTILPLFIEEVGNLKTRVASTTGLLFAVTAPPPAFPLSPSVI